MSVSSVTVSDILLQPGPALPLIDVSDRMNRDSELSRYGLLADFCRASTADSAHIVFRQYMPTVALSASVRTVTETILAIFWLSPPSEVLRPPIVLPATRAVQCFQTGRARASKSFQHKLMDPADPYPVFTQTDNQVPVCYPRCELQNPGAAARSFRKAAHAPEVRHLVQTLVAGYRQPALGNIVCSHGDLLQDRRVRPGHCSGQRGRADLTLAGGY